VAGETSAVVSRRNGKTCKDNYKLDLEGKKLPTELTFHS
jgi:hypothetical protein